MILMTTYDAQFYTAIELPDGKTKADIEFVSVVWGQIDITFFDGTSLVIQESETAEFDAQKEPTSFQFI